MEMKLHVCHRILSKLSTVIFRWKYYLICTRLFSIFMHVVKINNYNSLKYYATLKLEIENNIWLVSGVVDWNVNNLISYPIRCLREHQEPNEAKYAFFQAELFTRNTAKWCWYQRQLDVDVFKYERKWSGIIRTRIISLRPFYTLIFLLFLSENVIKIITY